MITATLEGKTFFCTVTVGSTYRPNRLSEPQAPRHCSMWRILCCSSLFLQNSDNTSPPQKACFGKGVDAALKGEEVLGAIYSQEKRMQEGYYDCSSFVWRSYNAAGLKIGNVNSANVLQSQNKFILFKSD